MAMIIPGIFIPTSFNKTMVLRNKRGILNRVESSLVCNVSATNFRVNPDFSAVFGYLNVKHWNNSIYFMASQDALGPLRTFVLGGFSYIFIENCGRILLY